MRQLPALLCFATSSASAALPAAVLSAPAAAAPQNRCLSGLPGPLHPAGPELADPAVVSLLAHSFVRGAREADGDLELYGSQTEQNIRTSAGHCGESPAGVAGVARSSEVLLGFPPCSGTFGLTSPLVPGSSSGDQGEGEDSGDDEGAAEEEAEAAAEAQEGVAAGYVRDGNRRRPRLRLPDDDSALRSFVSREVSWLGSGCHVILWGRHWHCLLLYLWLYCCACGRLMMLSRLRVHSQATPTFPLCRFCLQLELRNIKLAAGKLAPICIAFRAACTLRQMEDACSFDIEGDEDAASGGLALSLTVRPA